MAIAGGQLALPALFTADVVTARRTLEFFTAHIRNPHTRRAYARAAARFSDWCSAAGIERLQEVQPLHVAAYVEILQEQVTAPTVKLQLAAIRMLFDWLVIGQAIEPGIERAPSRLDLPALAKAEFSLRVRADVEPAVRRLATILAEGLRRAK
jgi:hypothetical protein